ncbi:MAG: hydrogenase maturation nickel metallochaperone HypA [Desulfovibrionales bacterium]
MHELAIAQNLIDLIRQEMEKHKADRLLKVKVKYGRLTQIVPEALQLSFEALVRGTNMEDAVLETEEIPLVVKCRECGNEFTPKEEDSLLMPCPKCGTEFGHEVISGKELYLDHLEAE